MKQQDTSSSVAMAPASTLPISEQPALGDENSVAQGLLSESGQGLSDGLGGLFDLAETELTLTQIPNQDVIYEQLAKIIAYQKDGDEDATVAQWGYEIDHRIGPRDDPSTGFGMVMLAPTREALADPRFQEMHGRPLQPVLAFRGSDMRDLENMRNDLVKDWLENDLEADCVGMPQFEAHKSDIEDALRSRPGADVVGHSLGGALAQLAACLVGGVGRIVTFQSPGIDASIAEQLDENVESTHYRIKGDVVPLVGDAVTDGTVVEFDAGPLAPHEAHTVFPLEEVASERGLDIPGLETDGNRELDLRGADRTHSDDVAFEGEDFRSWLALVIRQFNDLFYEWGGPLETLLDLAVLRAQLQMLVLEFLVTYPQVREKQGWDEAEAVLFEWVLASIRDALTKAGQVPTPAEVVARAVTKGVRAIVEALAV